MEFLSTIQELLRYETKTKRNEKQGSSSVM